MLPPMAYRRVSVNKPIETDATRPRHSQSQDTAAYPCTPLTSCNLHHSSPNSSARETISRHSGNTAIHILPKDGHANTSCSLLSTRIARKLTGRESTSTSRVNHATGVHIPGLHQKQGIRLYHTLPLHHPACPGGAAAINAADLTSCRG